MIRLFIISTIFYVISSVCGQLSNMDVSNSTIIKTRNVSALGRIIVKEIIQPHNLFIGRCTKNYPVLHQENVVLNNDGKSQVTANIRMNVEGAVSIKCVKVYDEDPETSAYPSYSSGGIGHNFVEFNVLTAFGKGFKFFVQIFGNKIPE